VEVAMYIRVAVLALTLLGLSSGFGFAQTSEPKKKAPNEADVILQDSKKSDRETPKEVSECMSQWGPQTQMTKEEWGASCRRTLRYFPESR
jgi:hypothetical protein